MAQTICSLTIEAELFVDAIEALKLVAERLPKRHGDDFRRLDRRLSQILEGEVDVASPTFEYLDGGRMVIVPPRQLLDIVDEAIRLGVI